MNRARRRCLNVRDAGCRFPGASGRTDLDNLILLCDYHHHLVHTTGWIVKFDGHDAHFIDPTGTEIRGP